MLFQLNPFSASVNPSSASSLPIFGQSASRIGDCRGTGGDEWSVVGGGVGNMCRYDDEFPRWGIGRFG